MTKAWSALRAQRRQDAVDLAMLCGCPKAATVIALEGYGPSVIESARRSVTRDDAVLSYLRRMFRGWDNHREAI